MTRLLASLPLLPLLLPLLLLPLLLLLLSQMPALADCLETRPVSSSQSKSFWDQIKANNEQRQAARHLDDGSSSNRGGGSSSGGGGAGGGGGASAASSIRSTGQSPSLREVLESRKARRNLECRPDFCYRVGATARGGTAAATQSPQICGTDGKTYESRCMLQFLRRCHGQKVKVRHLGACGAPIAPPGGGADGAGGGVSNGGRHARRRNCQQSRVAALAQSSRGEQVIFVPQCRRDGKFRRVQCNYQLKYCFCVRKKSGKPLPGTGVQLPNRPRCKRRRSRGRSRRLRNQHRKKKKKKKQGGRRGKKKGRGRKNRCTSRQRAQFNRNILKQFEIEFNATVNSRGGIFKPRREASGLPIRGVVEKTLRQPERRSAEWKFTELDANSDGQLSYRETKALRKVTRANIKPKSCARRFFSTCDLNSNKRLERAEWVLCFGLENPDMAAVAAQAEAKAAEFAAAAAAESAAGAAAAAAVAVVVATPAAPAAIAAPMVLGGGGGAGSSSKGSLMELVSRRRKRNRAKKARPLFARKSCPLAREEALQKNRQHVRQLQYQRSHVLGMAGRVFVPECTPDGKYAKRQCHSADAAASEDSDRLCFCMDPDTGRVLKSRRGAGGRAGGSGRSGVVDCESAHLRARAAASAGSRGCTQPLLRQFAGQLTALLVQETRDAWTPLDRHLSVEARSLRLRFQRADVNRDGRLDRKEQRWWRRDVRARWKASRELRATRKCAANFLRFCNADGDDAVTLQELQACLALPASA